MRPTEKVSRANVSRWEEWVLEPGFGASSGSASISQFPARCQRQTLGWMGASQAAAGLQLNKLKGFWSSLRAQSQVMRSEREVLSHLYSRTHTTVQLHTASNVIGNLPDANVIGLITTRETAYRRGEYPTKCARRNHLFNQHRKTKELVVDCRDRAETTPITATNDLWSGKQLRSSAFTSRGSTWVPHTEAVLKRHISDSSVPDTAEKFGMSPSSLRSFYTCTLESTWPAGMHRRVLETAPLAKTAKLCKGCANCRHSVGGWASSLQDILHSGV